MHSSLVGVGLIITVTKLLDVTGRAGDRKVVLVDWNHLEFACSLGSFAQELLFALLLPLLFLFFFFLYLLLLLS